ncbi:hypothetical protein [Thermocatellispora tengchongensis]|uniref:hypothetical protein n=1 Tax=Thermocatellispora tengchongensis TaxID=1073253 RepID=UPI00363F17FC
MQHDELDGRALPEREGAPAVAAPPPWWRARPWHLALAAVAICYSAVQLAFTTRIGLGWDESVYLSQVARGVPAAEFTASRARGVPLLVAPVAVFTPSVTAVRVYLGLLSGAGLYLAYRPWLRLRPGPVVPVAAALFAGLWLSLFYANEVMPNMWVAYCAVAGVALACLAGGRRPLRPVAGLVAVFAAASLLRPSDATWLALPLLVYAAVTRRLLVAGCVAAGLAIGWGSGPWRRSCTTAVRSRGSGRRRWRTRRGCTSPCPTTCAPWTAPCCAASASAAAVSRRSRSPGSPPCRSSRSWASWPRGGAPSRWPWPPRRPWPSPTSSRSGTPRRASCCPRTRCWRCPSPRAWPGRAGGARPRCSPSRACCATSPCRA